VFRVALAKLAYRNSVVMFMFITFLEMLHNEITKKNQHSRPVQRLREVNTGPAASSEGLLFGRTNRGTKTQHQETTRQI